MASSQPTAWPQSGRIVFVSLGLAILDELHLSDGTVMRDVPGGSGLYSTAGACISTKVAPSDGLVGCLIIVGGDFPQSVVETLESWNLRVFMESDPTKLSTRCRIEYRGENFSDRLFSFTTDPLQPVPSHLDETPLLGSKAFHFLATPEELATTVAQLEQLRARDGLDSEPLLVWEPTPTCCTLAHREAHFRAANRIDVYSPNHFEFLATFGSGGGPTPPVFDKAEIERLTLELLQSGVGRGGNGVVVIRCGESGSLVASRSFPPRWFPAFHDASSGMFSDATGAGNTFLGGFAVRFSETGDLEEAAIAGTVAASFAIEQIGLPRKSVVDGRIMWNGEDPLSRAWSYRARHLGAQA